MNAEEKLASIFQQKKTAPFLFIGSGFTRHYLDSPTWLEILEKFAPKHINSYISSIGETNLPKIAQIVGKEINDHFWNLPTNDPFKQKIQDKITTPTAVLRYQIAEELKKLDINNIDSKYNDEIKLLQHINIDGIITTNWDDILEQLFPKYTKLVGQEDLLTMHSYCIGEIYKIHGCIHQPATMILTEEDYSNFSKKNTYLAAKLITIFLEHPIIFLGYSISDPNIQDILKSIIACLSSKKLNDLKNNLFFVEWNPSPDTSMNIYNHEFQNNGVIIPTTRIFTHDYTPIYRAINSFEREIPAPVLRHYKKQFYQIVYAEKPEKQLYVIDEKDIDYNKDIQFVVGFGAIQKYNSAVGYVGMSAANLFSDLILEDKKYDPISILTKTRPNLSGLLPQYKYLNQIGITSEEEYTQNKLGLNGPLNSLTSFQVNQYKNQAEHETKGKSIEDIVKNTDPKKVCVFIPYMQITEPDLPHILDFLKKNFHDFMIKKTYGSSYTSHYRKLACLYDWLKYGWLPQNESKKIITKRLKFK
jgi:phage protein|nr:MAG TPA: SIR2 family protein [Caudoviricetes sp.]